MLNDPVALMRQKFLREGLERRELDPNPMKQFEQWYQQAIDSNLYEPNALCLATVDAHGQAWQRMVLLKLYDQQGFIFFTNYGSRKATHISANGAVSLLFPWHPLGRQVKITGKAQKISASDSLKYFITRPRGSQLGAWASPQSQIIDSRAVLESMVEQVKQRFADKEIPVPSFWGGYLVQPETIEFWQARENRLHDRFFYQRIDAVNWELRRLAP